MRYRLLTSALVVMMIGTAVSTAAADTTVTFTRVARGGDPIPDMPGETFDSFGFRRQVLDNTDLAFRGFRPLGVQAGLYVYRDGTLETVADGNTLKPGSAETFTLFSYPSLSGDTVVFPAGDGFLYAADSGGLSVLADDSTPYPGGTVFGGFGEPVVSGGVVAFFGSEGGLSSASGIFTLSGGSVTTVADKDTPIPGGSGDFTALEQYPGLSGGNVVFRGYGSDSQQGVYLSSGGSLERVADKTTAIPGGSGTFSGFSIPGISGTDVVFGADGAIFRYSGGVLSRIVDMDTVVPGDTGTFDGFNDPVISNGNVAFRGYTAGDFGIFAIIDGTLLTIAREGDTIDGDLLTGFYAQVAISGNRIAFGAVTSGGEALYIATAEVNTPPVIGGTPDTAAGEGVAYSFTPTADDPDAGDTLTFSITNRPAWADFDEATGALTGIPGSAHIGVHAGIVIAVSDGHESAELPAFDITVSGSAVIGSEVAIDVAGHAGLAVRNATVSLAGTGFSTTTDADGGFSIDSVPSGTYTLTVSAPDIPTVETEVVVAAGQILALDPIQMTSGAFTQADIDQAAADEQARWDAGGDGQKGLAEAIDALQVVSGVRLP